MKPTPKARGPWTHKLLVYAFSVAFGVLVYWLLGFVLRDIGTWPGPDYAAIERRLVDPQLGQEAQALQTQVADINRLIAEQQQRQAMLRDSTGNAEKTLSQLLELQRVALEQQRVPAAEEQAVLLEAQRRFLTNQTRYQALNEQISVLHEQLRQLESQLRTVQEQREQQRPPVQAEFQRLLSRHQLKLAALKLAFLLPVLVVAVWLFLKHRGSLYTPLIHGLGLATILKVGWVIHDHFPRRYFKYILIGTTLFVVARVLIYLLRSAAHPKPDWLLKQYREAYERFRCPVCSHPIRRGPLKYLFWSRRNLRHAAGVAPGSPPPDEPYTCPVCGTRLFEPCPACRTTRHALLPVCTHCGAEKPLEPTTEAADQPGPRPA
jgi:predicted RNA-binding Zn-ribbon protein involved in translation (DUF1610 family)